MRFLAFTLSAALLLACGHAGSKAPARQASPPPVASAAGPSVPAMPSSVQPVPTVVVPVRAQPASPSPAAASVTRTLAATPALGTGAATTASSTPTRSRGVPRLTGGALITRDQGLYLRDMATGKERSVFTAPSGSFVAFPAWSPDGKRFAFTVVTPFAGRVDGGVADWGGDLYVADANGGNHRMLLKHDSPGAQQQAIAWTPDGMALVFTYLAFSYDSQGQFTGQVEQARRLDLATGAVTTLVDNATDTDLCRDGSRLVYVAFDPRTNSRASLMVAGADGRNARAILEVSEQIQNFTYPRFSPDCSHLVFAANGAAARHLAPSAPVIAGLPSGRGSTEPFAPALHGLPYELWSIGVDGSGLTQLTHFAEDEPYPAWSPDGRALLIQGARSLYAMAADGSDLTALGSGVTQGQLAWR